MKRTLKILASIAVIAVALNLLDWEGLKAAILDINPAILVVATVVLLFEYPILGFRWYELVREYARLSFYEHFRRFLVAALLNSVTPAQFGGDVYRWFSLKSAASSGRDIFATLLQERFIGLLGYLLFYLVCLAVVIVTGGETFGDATMGFLAFGAVTLAGFLLLPVLPTAVRFFAARAWVEYRTWLKQTLSMAAQVLDFGSAKRALLLFGLSLVSCAIWTSVILVVARDVEVYASFALLGVLGVVVELIRLVPVTIQGIGVREGLFAYFFGLCGLSPEKGFVVGVVVYFALSVSTLLAGIAGRLLPESSN